MKFILLALPFLLSVGYAKENSSEPYTVCRRVFDLIFDQRQQPVMRAVIGASHYIPGLENNLRYQYENVVSRLGTSPDTVGDIRFVLNGPFGDLRSKAVRAGLPVVLDRSEVLKVEASRLLDELGRDIEPDVRNEALNVVINLQTYAPTVFLIRATADSNSWIALRALNALRERSDPIFFEALKVVIREEPRGVPDDRLEEFYEGRLRLLDLVKGRRDFETLKFLLVIFEMDWPARINWTFCKRFYIKAANLLAEMDVRETRFAMLKIVSSEAVRFPSEPYNTIGPILDDSRRLLMLRHYLDITYRRGHRYDWKMINRIFSRPSEEKWAFPPADRQLRQAIIGGVYQGLGHDPFVRQFYKSLLKTPLHRVGVTALSPEGYPDSAQLAEQALVRSLLAKAQHERATAHLKLVRAR